MRIFVVDAFTDTVFKGNPAGICLLDEPAEPAWMQRLAAEMRHSETAYLVPTPDGPGDYGLRWFTPAAEVRLCGHATLASAWVLFTEGLADKAVDFDTASGILSARRSDGDTITLDFPARPLTGPAPAEIVQIAERALAVPIVQAGTAGDDLLIEVADAATVQGLAPEIPALLSIPARGIVVTAPADADSSYDIVSRFFAPSVGVPEDPFTGSAHCALMPFWGQRLGTDTLRARQLSERTGDAVLGLTGDRVILTGHAVTILAGTLSPDAQPKP